MEIFDAIALRIKRRLPLIIQTESTECGLACLGMIAGYHGQHTNLMQLRQRFSISLKGINLKQLIQTAHQMQLGTRALKLDLGDIAQLRLPCVLHWNLNHFVVLKAVKKKSVLIHDPAHGIRCLSLGELSGSFTGIALEMWPSNGFEKQEAKPTVKLMSLLGRVTGLYRSMGQVLILALVLEFLSLLSPFFLQWIIDEVLVSQDHHLLTTLLLGFLLLLLMQQTVSGVREWMIMHLSTLLNVQWRANIFGHLLRLPTDFFEKRHLGDVVSRFGAIDNIQQTLTSAFLTAILDGVVTVGTLGLMFIYSPALTCISLTTMFIYGCCRWAWYRPLRNATEEQIIHTARQQSHFLETIRGIRPIKLFQRQSERRNSWLSLLVEQVNAGLRTQKLHLFYGQINGLLFGITNLVVIWLGALMVIEGKFTVGALMAFNAYKSQFDARVGALIDQYFELHMLRLQGERLADIVLHTPEEEQFIMDPQHSQSIEASIKIIGLSYRYSEHDPLVIDNINLNIAAGESIAIVGPSGCGKSTLLKIIIGTLEPSQGSLKIGDLNLSHLGSNGVRQLIATVLQDDVLFAGSLAENISFFDSRIDMPWVNACAELAAIHSDIMSMAMGYNTLVGDMGTVLSGGQKQRILLARALYKKPKILLLDEATSHLDVACERQVNNAIRSLNITRVIIAHRPETIASADRVVELGNGKIISDRSHTSLKCNAAVPRDIATDAALP